MALRAARSAIAVRVSRVALPRCGTSTTFSVLVENTTTDTTASYKTIQVTVPAGYSNVSVASTAFTAGTGTWTTFVTGNNTTGPETITAYSSAAMQAWDVPYKHTRPCRCR